MTSTALAKRTWTDLVRSVAWTYGFEYSTEQADYLLWEYTAFPMADLATVNLQIHDAFISLSATGDYPLRPGIDEPFPEDAAPVETENQQ